MKLPRDWVRLSPNGIGHQKPNHYKEMVKVAWKVKGNGRKAWKILSEGVCDGCALGVAGFHDWTLDGVHLCTTRLRLLEVNCAEPFDHTVLGDVSWLRNLSSTDLRDLGRLAHPMRRRRGEPGFTQISWDEALDAVADGIRAAGGDRTAIYLTSRGITNEVYYVAAKAARAMGVANIDSAARTCHAPSTVGLKQTIGVAASTCSMQDVLETDLIVLWGTNVANNQPVFTKYLYLARKRGARVVVVNPYLEPGLERYWVPSNAESALFGTKLCDLHVPVRPEGDVALANAVLQRLIERDAVDHDWIAEHTEGWDELAAHVTGLDRTTLLEQAGVDADHVRALRRPLRRGVDGGPHLEHGHHPAHPRRRGRAGDRQRRPGPRQRRARRRRADADPRPLGRAGRRRDGRLRDRAPGRRSGRRRPRRAVGQAVGLRGARARRADGAGDGRGRRSGATSTCCSSTARTSSR